MLTKVSQMLINGLIRKNKMFVYFLILCETFTKKKQNKKQILQWKCRPKDAAELIPKEKKLNCKICLIQTQRITNPKL